MSSLGIGIGGNGELQREMSRNRNDRETILLRLPRDFSAEIPEAVERVPLGVARDVDDLLDQTAVSDLADDKPVDPDPARVENDYP